jgi:hypothetical protein
MHSTVIQNDWTITHWKQHRRKWSQYNFMYHPSILLEGLRKYGMVRDLRIICNFCSDNVKHDVQTKNIFSFLFNDDN